MFKPLDSLLAELRGGPRNEDRLTSLVRLRRTGYTLRQVALASGVHVATICRWMKRNPVLREAMREAKEEARQQLRAEDDSRPQVQWRRDCPLCQAKVVVRSATGKARFWRCGRWPECPWASWRPRASRNCRRCGAARYWSHSRKSIVCSGCGVRTRAH
jgi:ssDNA-binding Zn-finger/Zn-ribbon topoisomerase 1